MTISVRLESRLRIKPLSAE